MRYRAVGNGTALRKLPGKEAVMNDSKHAGFDTADITALSHLYRGEVYRSTVWRTRLDATTNWAVVTTGLALSLTFSSETASPLPLVLVGLLRSEERRVGKECRSVWGVDDENRCE